MGVVSSKGGASMSMFFRALFDKPCNTRKRQLETISRLGSVTREAVLPRVFFLGFSEDLTNAVVHPRVPLGNFVAEPCFSNCVLPRVIILLRWLEDMLDTSPVTHPSFVSQG